jgi:hypothetical protein
MKESDYEKLVNVYFVISRNSSGNMIELEFQGQEWVDAEGVHDNIDHGSVLYVTTEGTQTRRKVR